MRSFSDRLTDAVRSKGNSVCVGLDPRWDALPLALRTRHADGTLTAVARAFEEFCVRIIDIVSPLVPIVKPQSAFFEACGPAGLAALQRVLRRARQVGLVTILDGKRNDIASTAEAYADAAFGGVSVGDGIHTVWGADALTVNPYLGDDSIEPFVRRAREAGCGVFLLVRTSNRGAGQFQNLVCDGKPLFMHVAQAVGAWSQSTKGKSGLGDIGAVIGATAPTELATIRAELPDTWFLVPGYGSQGASAADTAAAFRPDGLGAIINNSRGIIASFPPDTLNWEERIETATRDTIRVLKEATPMGRIQ